MVIVHGSGTGTFFVPLRAEEWPCLRVGPVRSRLLSGLAPTGLAIGLLMEMR